jgi:MtN3 and saliva related transmembrane protein
LSICFATGCLKTAPRGNGTVFWELGTSFVQTIGFFAGSLTTVAFAPQVYQTWKTGGRGLSWPMLLLFGSGVALWLVYGLMLEAWPIIVANGLTMVQLVLIVALKRRSLS